MGSYREAISAFLGGQDSAPDITVHRLQGRVKYGFGLNAEQELTRDLRAFGRLGWNDGANESRLHRSGSNCAVRRRLSLLEAFQGQGRRRPRHQRQFRRPPALSGCGVSFAFDVQQISNPGYNQDRGQYCCLASAFIEDSLNAWRIKVTEGHRWAILAAGQLAARGTTPGYRARRYGTCRRKSHPCTCAVHWPRLEGTRAESRP